MPDKLEYKKSIGLAEYAYEVTLNVAIVDFFQSDEGKSQQKSIIAEMSEGDVVLFGLERDLPVGDYAVSVNRIDDAGGWDKIGYLSPEWAHQIYQDLQIGKSCVATIYEISPEIISVNIDIYGRESGEPLGLV